jgi:prolipoprotein diacylglyceryl transferase
MFRLDVGPVTLAPHWYGLLFAGGFLVGFYVMQWMFRREGHPVAHLDALLVYLLVGTLAGARLAHCFFYEPSYYLARPLAIVRVWEGGLASHGGLAGVLAGLALYARGRPGQPYLWLLDRVAVPAALGGAFVRVGNLFNHEIVGVPADVPWAFVFTRVDAVPRHPAQLYEAGAYLAVFGLLLATYRRLGARTPHGLLSGLFLALVFTARVAIETVKVRQAAFAEGWALSVGQMLSLPMIAAGVALLAYAYRRRCRTSEDA